MRLLYSFPLVFGLTGPLVSFQPQSPNRFVSTDGSFVLNVPPSYVIQVGKNKFSRSYIPVCQAETDVCVEYPSGHYVGTTFGDASVQITLLSPKTYKACLEPSKYEWSTSPDAMFQIDEKSPTRIIDGARFWHSYFGAAAMSHDVIVNAYRGYKNGRCFQLEIRVTFTNFGAYDPGAIKEFTKQDQQHVTRQLSRILDSFHVLP